jgi:hypothetical protein
LRAQRGRHRRRKLRGAVQVRQARGRLDTGTHTHERCRRRGQGEAKGRFSGRDYSCLPASMRKVLTASHSSHYSLQHSLIDAHDGLVSCSVRLVPPSPYTLRHRLPIVYLEYCYTKIYTVTRSRRAKTCSPGRLGSVLACRFLY